MRGGLRNLIMSGVMSSCAFSACAAHCCGCFRGLFMCSPVLWLFSTRSSQWRTDSRSCRAGACAAQCCGCFRDLFMCSPVLRRLLPSPSCAAMCCGGCFRDLFMCSPVLRRRFESFKKKRNVIFMQNGITITLSAAARLAPSCCACQAFLQLPGQESARPSF